MNEFTLNQRLPVPIASIIAGLVITLLTGSWLQAAKPQVALRSTLLYPRSDLQESEELIWRGQVVIHHRLTPRFSWHLLGDATPATLTRSAGLRIYSGYLHARLTGSLNLNVGRQMLWNTLHAARFDGAMAEWRKVTPGASKKITLYAGLVPGNELRNDYGDSCTVVAGGLWQRSRGTTHYSLQLWTNEMQGEGRVYLGGTLRHRLGARITQISDLAVNLLETSLDKVRLRTQIRLSAKVSTFIQYRYAGHLTLAPYPWYDDPLEPRHAISTGIQYRLARGLQLRLSLVERITETQNRYLAAQVLWGGFALAWQSRSQSTYEGQSFQLSWQRTLFTTMRIGASVGSSMYTPFDDQSPAVVDLMGVVKDHTAVAATGWLQGTVGRHLGYRLFAQYSENRYFKRDGRLGLQLSYAF